MVENLNVDVTHTYGWHLDKGRVRKNNQDSLATLKFRQASEGESYSVGIYIVADGVAGAAEGEIASKIAVETAMHEMVNHLEYDASDEQYQRWLVDAASIAHKRLLSRNNEMTQSSATTLLMAVVINTVVHILNIGDSRAYVLADGNLRQITSDHTLAQMLLDAGAITEEEAVKHPYRNVLAQAVGIEQEINADVYVESLQVGNYLLLCSDGLYGVVPDEKIVEIISSADSMPEATRALTDAANQGGGNDNIAVIVVQITAR